MTTPFVDVREGESHMTYVPSVMLAGDWHGNTSHARWVIQRAASTGHPRVFQLGDFGYWEHEPSGVKYLDDLDKFATDADVVLYFLRGNHDNIRLLRSRYHDTDDEGFVLVRPHVRFARDGHRWTWNGTRFIAIGGAYSVDKNYRLRAEAVKAERIRRQNEYRTTEQQRSVDTSNTIWFPEEELTDEEVSAFLEDRTPVDVMLTHDKPRGSNPMWNRKDIMSCWANQDRLQLALKTLQCKALFHGHLHFGYQDKVAINQHQDCRVFGLDADLEASGSGSRLASIHLFDPDEDLV